MGKTGPPCGCCTHEYRHLIELGLVHKVPVRVLSRRFGLTKDQIFRHRQLHMPPQLKAAILTATRPNACDLEQLQRDESSGLLAACVSQRARLQMLSEMAFAEGEVHAATSVERAITGSLELTAKLLGELVTRHEVTHTSILISADYLKLRAVIIGALKPYPQAAQAVGAALATLETEAAETITNSKKPLLLEANPA